MKVVINCCYGGFEVSSRALKVLGMTKAESYYIPRTDARLVALIEELGSEFVSGSYSSLKVIEIPKGATDYIIREYDGYENILFVLDGRIYIEG